jgi:two-component system, OmpR family, response regulator
VRLLVVEDEARLAAALQRGLQAEGFAVDVAGDGQDGLEMARHGGYDAMILDVMLPRLSGYRVVRQLRAERNWVPVLMLSAKDGEYDQADGLDCGADDYLTKPFSYIVLLARLRALLRRTQARGAADSRALEFGALRILTDDRSVTWRGQPCLLSNTEYKLLLVLAEAAGRVLSRDELLKKMRGIEFDGLDRSIDNCISKLRKKFDDNLSEKIKTVWGEGYLFSPSAWN